MICTLMKHLLLLWFAPLIFLVTLLPAQEVREVSHPWQIGLVYAQDNQLPLGTFGPREPDGFDYTEDKWNSTFGISVMRDLDRHWSLRSGMLYSKRDVTGVYYCQTCDPSGESAFLPIRYLTLPIAVRYQIPLRRFSIFGETGIVTGFLLNGPQQEYQFIGRMPSGAALLESVSSIGGSIRMSNRLTAHLGVQYTRTIYHIDYEYGYDWRFRLLSLEAGIHMRLGKTRQNPNPG